MAPFSMLLNDPNPDFKVTPLFDAEYLKRNYNGILIGTYRRPTRVSFQTTLSDLEWLSEIFSDTKHRMVSLRPADLVIDCICVCDVLHCSVIISDYHQLLQTLRQYSYTERRVSIRYCVCLRVCMLVAFEPLIAADRTSNELITQEQTERQTDWPTANHRVISLTVWQSILIQSIRDRLSQKQTDRPTNRLISCTENKCIGDDTKASARRSPNCIK